MYSLFRRAVQRFNVLVIATLKIQKSEYLLCLFSAVKLCLIRGKILYFKIVNDKGFSYVREKLILHCTCEVYSFFKYLLCEIKKKKNQGFEYLLDSLLLNHI